MKQTSRINPLVTIDYHTPAPNTAAGFSFTLDEGKHYPPAELKEKLNLTDRQLTLLRAEACDLVWPLSDGGQLASVTVKHDKGQYVTSFNALVGRAGIVDYFLHNTVYVNLGLAGEDEDGTACTVSALVINNDTFGS